MFTRQRKNYRIFVYAALIIVLCVLLAALLWPQEPSAPAESEHLAAQGGSKPMQQSDPGSSVSGAEADAEADREQDNEQDNETGSEPVLEDGQEAYYIVKRSGDSVSVFFCTASGEEIELEETDIVYELLTPEDQKQFDEGLRAQSQEELSAILQDFAS